MLAGSGVELLDTAAEIALTHHERCDGAGYPRGLAGEEIPLAGRIAAVADAFDALTTDRVYRAAGSVEQRRRDAARRARAPLRPARRRRLPGGARRRRGDPRALPAAAGGAAGERAARTSRSRSRPPPRRSRSPPAGCAAGPTRGGSRASAPPAGTAASRSRPSAGSPPSAACARRSAPSSRPRPRSRCSRENLRAHGRQLAAAAAAAIYREGPPGWFASEGAARDLRDWIDRAAARAARAASTRARCRPPRR